MHSDQIWPLYPTQSGAYLYWQRKHVHCLPPNKGAGTLPSNRNPPHWRGTRSSKSSTEICQWSWRQRSHCCQQSAPNPSRGNCDSCQPRKSSRTAMSSYGSRWLWMHTHLWISIVQIMCMSEHKGIKSICFTLQRTCRERNVNVRFYESQVRWVSVGSLIRRFQTKESCHRRFIGRASLAGVTAELIDIEIIA